MPDITHIHLDAVGGIAGDMFVAAVLDALPHLSGQVFADLAAVLPADCGEPILDAGTSSSIAVTRFMLRTSSAKQRSTHSHTHHHGDGHEHSHEHAHHHGHNAERIEHFPDLVACIRKAAIPSATADVAVAILTRLAEAESRMHRVPLEDVHFHELADWDSLMDVVAAASIIASLGNVIWSVSDLPRGHGLVRTAHGLLPVPAPATAEMLKGFSWRDDGIGGERVTPTGAAILAYLIPPEASSRASGQLISVGNGAGTRDLPGLPNILRAMVFAKTTTMAPRVDDVMTVEFDIDDMTGEEIAVAADRLRSADGVLDLTIGHRHGKKGRAVADFRLLVRPDRIEQISELCFSETSTIGLRQRREARLCLARNTEAVSAEGRILRRKRVTLPGGISTVKVESDDLLSDDGLIARRRLKHLGESGEKIT